MLDVRPATSDEDLAHIARIVCSVTPDFPTSVVEMRWSEQAYPGGRRFLAWLDGEPVGSGGAGRMYNYPPEYEGLWGSIVVLPEHRRQGVGGASLSAVSRFTREAGKGLLIGRVTADRLDAIEFLEHRGFAEYERMKAVRLDLAGRVAEPVESPPGVLMSSLEERPDLVEGVYRVALEAMPDRPRTTSRTPRCVR